MSHSLHGDGRLWLVVGLGLIAGLGGYILIPWWRTAQRVVRLRQYLANPAAHSDWLVMGGERCGIAPFMMPTTGYVGFLYGDSWRPGQRHQGIDIFAPTDVGGTAVVAAYAGYLTRLPEWKSSLIIRIPHDPLHAERQIWTYYTHLADAQGNSLINPDFPPGTHERYVAAGTLLGYQGNYSGDPLHPVGVHLHFSIVLDEGHGHFKNELRIENTLDPAPYLGLSGSFCVAGEQDGTHQ